uniref:Uncharacterized protein n=1 Tax=Aotus nancymaae TaxID=37293 RepID=A0A2K5EIS0_AOTNA
PCWSGWRGWGCGSAGSCEELTVALVPPQLLRHSKFHFFIQEKCEFRKTSSEVEPRRSDTGTTGEAYKRSALIPTVEETVFYLSPYPIRRMRIKPLFFTVEFTGCAFGSAAIWQCESLRSRVQSYFDSIEKGDFRKEIKKWWNNLSDGQQTVTGITAANVLVVCLWRVPSLHWTVIRYFTSNPYLSAGVISNFVSYMCEVATGRYGPSLARNALKAINAVDTAGMILGWKFSDYAAHFGGAPFGIWYVTYGHELIWKNREALVKIWHEMRTNGPQKRGGSK